LVSVLSEFFAQSVDDDAKEQGKDAEEAETQRRAEKFLCFLCFFCAFCGFFLQSVKIRVNRWIFSAESAAFSWID